MLARSRDRDRFVGKPLPSHLRNEARRHDGVTLTNNIDGARVLLAVAHSKLAEWRISVNAPVDVSEAQLTASLWLWGGVSAGIVSVAALLAFLLARRLEGPLNFTVDAARALGRGEPMLSFNSGLREANIVVDALNTASDELVARDKRQNLLLGELSHRVKNVLAVVQALVSRTLAEGRPDASEVVTQRLHALARAHDLLMKTDWQGAPLKDIIGAELSAHADQVDVAGPDITISAQSVQTLALILHELCTNAVKYGALSTHDGRVRITWAINDEGDAPRFRFCWKEHGDHPSPRRPGRDLADPIGVGDPRRRQRNTATSACGRRVQIQVECAARSHQAGTLMMRMGGSLAPMRLPLFGHTSTGAWSFSQLVRRTRMRCTPPQP